MISKRDSSATVGVVDIEAAPDPVKCKAFDAAKVNSTVVGEPCSQVCGTPNVGGDQTKCAECETACGALNCGCFGTNSDPALCDKHGALTTAGCTNPRANAGDSGDSGDGDSGDGDSDSGGGGGGDSDTINKLQKRGQSNLKKLQAARKINPTAHYARSCMDYTPTNWV